VRIDTHTHYTPIELVEVLRSGDGPASMSIEERGDRTFIVHANGLRYPMLPEFHDAATKLRAMDADGVDHAVISPTPTLFFWDDPAESVQLARLVNDAGAALVGRGDGRLHALASVPMNQPEEAAAELRRAKGLGLVGVEIGTSVGETMLDDPSLEPFWTAAEELSLPVMLHPYINMVSPPQPGLGSHHLSNVVGNPYETALAASRLIVSGLLDRHPGLSVQLSHGGGSFPYTLGRLDHAFDVRDETSSDIERRPSEYLHHFLFDTVVFRPRALDFLIDTVGAEHVVFGTDLPFDMADRSAADLAERAPADVADAVLGGNAARVYQLDVQHHKESAA
jgi:aminocarboxymuconate-semialdehyde decarboxylase